MKRRKNLMRIFLITWLTTINACAMMTLVPQSRYPGFKQLAQHQSQTIPDAGGSDGQ